MLLKYSAVVAAGILAFHATPSSADDWELACSFSGSAGPALVAQYDAGGPTYAVTVPRSGDSELGRGQKITVTPIRTSTDKVLIGAAAGELSLILRVNNEALAARLEVGSGASWDHKTYSGRCTANQQ